MKFLTLVALLVACASNNGVIARFEFEASFQLPKPAELLSGMRESLLAGVRDVVADNQQKFAGLNQDMNSPRLMGVELLQDFTQAENCLRFGAAQMMPCTSAFAAISENLNGLDQSTLSEIQTQLATSCNTCTEPAAEFAALTNATNCNIADPVQLQIWNVIETSISTICGETTRACAADSIFGFLQVADETASLCASQDCSLATLTPFIAGSLGPAAGAACYTGLLDLFCLEDPTPNSDGYCINFLSQFTDTSFAAACATPCLYNFTTGYQDLIDNGCYIGAEPEDTFEQRIVPLRCFVESARPFTILDFCTENEAEQNCFDVTLALQDRLSDPMADNGLEACPFNDLVPVPVPTEAPGPDVPEDVTPMCNATCAAGVSGLAMQLGCCTNIALDLLCGSNFLMDLDEIRAFIADDDVGCDIDLPMRCDRPTVFPGDVRSPTPTPSDIGVAAALKAVNVFALAIAVIFALMQ